MQAEPQHDQDTEHGWDPADAPRWPSDPDQARERARAWAVANPFAAMGIALAAGFAVGRIVRRLG